MKLLSRSLPRIITTATSALSWFIKRGAKKSALVTQLIGGVDWIVAQLFIFEKTFCELLCCLSLIKSFRKILCYHNLQSKLILFYLGYNWDFFVLSWLRQERYFAESILLQNTLNKEILLKLFTRICSSFWWIKNKKLYNGLFIKVPITSYRMWLAPL